MKMGSYYKSDYISGTANQPFFSVIITTYNRANILTRALDSLIGQTEHDWEAIIVDDESTDNTYLKLLPYLYSNPRIRYLRKVHSGEPLSKNSGINTSSGKFVTFLDSDDEFSPIHLQTRKAILTNNRGIRFLRRSNDIRKSVCTLTDLTIERKSI